MGTDGMGDMATMGMQVPKNSLPMVGGPGPFDYITMGGLFTVLKVRENLASYDDPGWYQNPPGTVADLASAEMLKRDGIEIPARKTAAKAGAYTCVMHPEVVSKEPGKCPKCGMKLTAQKASPTAKPGGGHKH